jgi:hypothetical protein
MRKTPEGHPLCSTQNRKCTWRKADRSTLVGNCSFANCMFELFQCRNFSRNLHQSTYSFPMTFLAFFHLQPLTSLPCLNYKSAWCHLCWNSKCWIWQSFPHPTSTISTSLKLWKRTKKSFPWCLYPHSLGGCIHFHSPCRHYRGSRIRNLSQIKGYFSHWCMRGTLSQCYFSGNQHTLCNSQGQSGNFGSEITVYTNLRSS